MRNIYKFICYENMQSDSPSITVWVKAKNQEEAKVMAMEKSEYAVVVELEEIIGVEVLE